MQGKRLTLSGDGSQTRQFTAAADVATLIVHAQEKIAGGAAPLISYTKLQCDPNQIYCVAIDGVLPIVTGAARSVQHLGSQHRPRFVAAIAKA
jgi:hypothetical protein